MPIAGPRSQFGPVPGYRNPDLEQSHRFNHWLRPGAVSVAGRTPGLMFTTLRGCLLGLGQVRQLWRQSVNLIEPQAPYSWASMSPAPGRQGTTPGPVGVTRALRYMTRSFYMRAGSDNTRFSGMHTHITKRHASKPVTTGSGRRNPPSVRNRMTSFGSRVPPINDPSPAAEPPA